jgi:hypothetical protein
VSEGVVSLKYIIIKIIERMRRGRRLGRWSKRRRRRGGGGIGGGKKEKERRIDTVMHILPLSYSDTRLYSTCYNNQNKSDNIKLLIYYLYTRKYTCALFI